MKPQVLVIGFVALLAAVWGFLPPFTVTLLCYIGLYSPVSMTRPTATSEYRPM